MVWLLQLQLLMLLQTALRGVAFYTTYDSGECSMNCYLNLVPSSYNGSNHNPEQPQWGMAGTEFVYRFISAAYGGDGLGSQPAGADQPSARKVLQELYLKDTPRVINNGGDDPNYSYFGDGYALSQLWSFWGVVVLSDMIGTQMNSSEPFDIPCDDGVLDLQCPFAECSASSSSSSDAAITYNRSTYGINETDGVRVPINTQTAWMDLDVLYGLDEATANSLRTYSGGRLNLTDGDIPHKLPDGDWLIGDERMAAHLGTMAIITLLMREHNRCADFISANLEAYEETYGCAVNGEAKSCNDWGDEELFAAARMKTIAVFQHITINEWAALVLGQSVEYTVNEHDETENPQQDVFWATVGSRFIWSTVGPMMRLVTAQLDDTPTFTQLPTRQATEPKVIEEVLYTYALEELIIGLSVTPCYESDASIIDDLTSFAYVNDPVLDVQRARDVGMPTYNEARRQLGLSEVADFAHICNDSYTTGLLSDLYGGDISKLEALTGGLAESRSVTGKSPVLSPLFLTVAQDVFVRMYTSDPLWHTHMNVLTEVSGSTISDLILRNPDPGSAGFQNFSDNAFYAASAQDYSSDCADSVNTLSISAGVYEMSWALTSSDITVTLDIVGMSDNGYAAIGLGSTTMQTADVMFVSVIDGDVSVEDRRSRDHVEPKKDTDVGGTNDVTLSSFAFVAASSSSLEQKLTVAFTRRLSTGDPDDEEITQSTMPFIWSYNLDAISKHGAGANGFGTVNFFTGSSTVAQSQSTTGFFTFHGIVMLAAWGFCAPAAIFIARYMKNMDTWLDLHEMLGIFVLEATIPLVIGAIATNGATLSTNHGKLGVFLFVFVCVQASTGLVRRLGIQNRFPAFVGDNYSKFHYINGYIHRYCGRIMLVFGLMQVWLGLYIISPSDSGSVSVGGLEDSGGDSLSFNVDIFGVIRNYLYWIVLGIYLLVFIYGEYRLHKQRTNLNLKVERLQNLPVFTLDQVSDRVLAGSKWVIVRDDVIDVGEFYKVHPGGSKVLKESLGTDITREILGERAVGQGVYTVPHRHSAAAWSAINNNVVGYIARHGLLATDVRKRGAKGADDDALEVSARARGGGGGGTAVRDALNRAGSSSLDRSFVKFIVVAKTIANDPKAASGTGGGVPGGFGALVGGINSTFNGPNPTAAVGDGKGNNNDNNGDAGDGGSSVGIRPLPFNASAVSRDVVVQGAAAAAAATTGEENNSSSGYVSKIKLEPVLKLVLRSSEVARLPAIIPGTYDKFRIVDSSTVVQRSYTPVRRRVLPDYDVYEYYIRAYKSGQMGRALAKVKPDDGLLVQGPFSIQELSIPKSYYYFVSGGTGVSPMLQTAMHYVRKNSRQRSVVMAKALGQNKVEKDDYNTRERRVVGEDTDDDVEQGQQGAPAAAKGGGGGGGGKVVAGGPEEADDGGDSDNDNDSDDEKCKVYGMTLLWQIKTTCDNFAASDLEELSKQGRGVFAYHIYARRRSKAASYREGKSEAIYAGEGTTIRRRPLANPFARLFHKKGGAGTTEGEPAQTEARPVLGGLTLESLTCRIKRRVGGSIGGRNTALVEEMSNPLRHDGDGSSSGGIDGGGAGGDGGGGGGGVGGSGGGSGGGSAGKGGPASARMNTMPALKDFSSLNLGLSRVSGNGHGNNGSDATTIMNATASSVPREGGVTTLAKVNERDEDDDDGADIENELGQGHLLSANGEVIIDRAFGDEEVAKGDSQQGNNNNRNALAAEESASPPVWGRAPTSKDVSDSSETIGVINQAVLEKHLEPVLKGIARWRLLEREKEERERGDKLSLQAQGPLSVLREYSKYDGGGDGHDNGGDNSVYGRDGVKMLPVRSLSLPARAFSGGESTQGEGKEEAGVGDELKEAVEEAGNGDGDGDGGDCSTGAVPLARATRTAWKAGPPPPPPTPDNTLIVVSGPPQFAEGMHELLVERLGIPKGMVLLLD